MKTFVNLGTWLFDMFLQEPARHRLEELGEVTYNTEHSPLSGEELREKCRGVDLLITGWTQPEIHDEDIPDVKVIAHTGGTVGGIIGMDVFDRHIVMSGNRYYAESVAEGVIAYMLFALRDMGYYTSELKKGNWAKNQTEGLIGQTVGIISLGAISRLVIDHLLHFRCRIKVYSTRPDPAYAEEKGVTFCSLEEIFSTCHIVSIHTAKNPQTIGMINRRLLSLMQPGAILLNTSRGPIVDEKALIDTLKEGKIRAVLDVYNKEPLPADSPLISLPNVILFPHQCGPTADRYTPITMELIEDAYRTLTTGDLPENLITADVARRMTIS